METLEKLQNKTVLFHIYEVKVPWVNVRSYNDDESYT